MIFIVLTLILVEISGILLVYYRKLKVGIILIVLGIIILFGLEYLKVGESLSSNSQTHLFHLQKRNILSFSSLILDTKTL
jgi:hypothetical protein